MKRDFSHLNTNLNIKYDPSETLLERMTSRIFWKDDFIANFLLYTQQMLMAGYKRIEYIINYKNPTI